MNNRGKKIYIVIWMTCLILLGVYYFAFAPKDSSYSEEENRNYAAFPMISAETLFSGEFGEELEAYLVDRFPIRNGIIRKVNEVQSLISLATHEEYLLVAEDVVDPLDQENFEDNIDELLSELTVDNDKEEWGNQDFVENGDSSEPEEISEVVEDVENPPIEAKPEISPDTFAATLNVVMQMNGETYYKGSYQKENVLSVTAVLNRYAELLPENGKLMFTVVPQSIVGNQFVNTKDKTAFYAEWDEVVNAMSSDNVYAFDTAEILSDAIRKGEYVYFRTDMHWTPYGSYLLYKEMVERAGKEAADYAEDYLHTMETPFYGTYYRDNPSAYADVIPDELDIVRPDFDLEWRRITAKDEYKEIDFINMNAKSNDRYTVYLGGPAGPWTYAECENGEEENCLVLTDSFGLGYIPFLTQNYKQVHYYDPRYYNYEEVGYDVAEMIEMYHIQDIYVIVGDLHSFDSGFLLSYAKEQLSVN